MKKLFIAVALVMLVFPARSMAADDSMSTLLTAEQDIKMAASEIDTLMVYGGGANYTDATIRKATAAIGSINKTTLVLRPGTWTISNTLTITSNIILKVFPGTKISILPSKTLTINSPFDAGLYKVFSCVGTGAVLGLVESKPEWFGASMTDASVAIQSALNSLANPGKLKLSGKYTILSIANTRLTIPHDNITIEGDGPDKTSITVSGKNECGLFFGLNRSNIQIRGIRFYGNNQASGGGGAYLNGSAIYFNANNSAAAITGKFVIGNCEFDNFRSAYWVCFLNSGSTYAMQNIEIRRNKFYSYSGNSQEPTVGTTPAFNVNVLGNGGSANGVINNIWIEDNYSNAHYIKGFCAVWQNISNAHINRNTVIDAGQSEPSSTGHAYAMQFYATNTKWISGYEISNNTIINPYSAGMYILGADNVSIRDNNISGQADKDDGTIPRGAIAINDCYNVTVKGGVLDSNYFGIEFVGANMTGVVNLIISGVKIINCGYKAIVLGGGVKTWSNATITGNTIQSNDIGIYMEVNSNYSFSDLLITENNFKCKRCIHAMDDKQKIPRMNLKANNF